MFPSSRWGFAAILCFPKSVWGYETFWRFLGSNGGMKHFMTRCKIRGTFGRHGPEKIIAQPVFIEVSSSFLKKLGNRMDFQKNITSDTVINM